MVRGYSPLEAASALLLIPVGVGAGTALAPPLLARVGARLPGAVGLTAMAAGFGLASTPGTVLIIDGLAHG